LIRILRSGPLNTVQDLGRPGGRRYGVGRSGAMDPVALEIGNLLLGNPSDEAGVEIAIFPFEIAFEAACAFAVSGAGSASLDGRPLPAGWASRAEAGQTLRVDPTRNGVFGYLAFAGGLDVPLRLGARATDLKAGFGGAGGRPLATGDRVGLREPESRSRIPAHGYGAAGSALPAGASPVGGGGLLRVIPAAEWETFTDEAIAAFLGEPWTVSREVNRTGYKLSGPELKTRRPLELASHGIVPGIVQVPPAGQPIVQMADANTCGGYPKLATVIAADLWRLAQTRSGETVAFAAVSWEDAVAAERELERGLDELDSVLRLARDRFAQEDRRRSP
jgi:biotin-dependent carboxylase-like uncharacterized protein